MVIASSQAGPVLVRPLFYRLNGHMRTLNINNNLLHFQSFWFTRWPFLTVTNHVLSAACAHS